MRILKKAFSVIFTLAFLLSVFAFDSTVVNATETTTEETTTEATTTEATTEESTTQETTAVSTYTYRIKISLGNNANAYFDDTAVAELEKNYTVSLSSSGKNLVISELAYDSNVTFNFGDLIKVKTDNTETETSKYYVKGLRVAGSDDLVKDTNKSVTLHVKGDESYVVAYGVGNIISYTVRYVDEDENELLPDETLYAAEGEVVYVPARHIKGYVPDYYFRTASNGLKKDTVFTFEYHKRVIGEETEVIEKTETSSSTVEGDPEYEYEYEYIDGGSTGTTTGGGNTTVTTQNNGGGNGGTVNNRADAGDGAGAGDADAGAAGNDGGETIEDDNTPGGILDIDDEEVAKAGGTRDTLIRNMIIGIIIAIIAVASILVTLYIANKKRKQELVKVEKHDDKE
ncbi:hypothetical protein SAMN02910413_1490 [Pseudobutyrivibrio sp. C4]|uniref:hypothetical protein n=1 Tax=Pseudobutyrivibrio sp. C4 TaxID=1520803 RepID=UPI0008B49D37|nr:hypothetical protein [Pseudobutyrivibrio sp. C4]SES97708.1 hypothetical protein SAMN02910413_1490 [Pseudobutyrivibrio sp. C4]